MNTNDPDTRHSGPISQIEFNGNCVFTIAVDKTDNLNQSYDNFIHVWNTDKTILLSLEYTFTLIGILKAHSSEDHLVLISSSNLFKIDYKQISQLDPIYFDPVPFEQLSKMQYNTLTIKSFFEERSKKNMKPEIKKCNIIETLHSKNISKLHTDGPDEKVRQAKELIISNADREL
eukprot:CAMPEP_0116893052 /NCGR_PEP_ID=MMETSP0467-20121206/3132_1 /TAXON_ID=283647 /ORGANISM="Mesodinium pulex, Strain SPMC105" /LENGTH=174 /DNA_ID=CAMNT_0004562509 /DNA_START=271 /DNA_END=795 /DNA_ORIENTATION=-